MQSACFLLVYGRAAVSQRSPQLLSAHVFTSACSLANEGRPPPAGERGRKEKNYQRNQSKKGRSDTHKTVDVQSLLKDMRNEESQSTSSATTLKELLAGIKVHIPTNEVTRRKLGLPRRSNVLSRSEREVARLKRVRLPENSMYPSAGPRLGVFNVPGPQTTVMPPAPPNLAEREHTEMVAGMQCLMPTNQFESDMTDVTFPRQFPIDNETANIGEEGVGFEDHVLLNHMLKGFPSRGPVSHFMEMVLTGLSKNPHYTAQEKRDYVEWYREYFAPFSDEELQTQPSASRKGAE